MSSIVEGLRLRFEDGRVVEVDADRNADALRSRIATDESAGRLGELALVDGIDATGKATPILRDDVWVLS